jgi:hypothetical protein
MRRFGIAKNWVITSLSQPGRRLEFRQRGDRVRMRGSGPAQNRTWVKCIAVKRWACKKAPVQR